VHGLGANPEYTWSAESGGERIFWLENPDFLPVQFPKARILRYGYHSEWLRGAPLATPTDHARELLALSARTGAAIR
jgi:hypothetical protein